jgi:hypothetical protein
LSESAIRLFAFFLLTLSLIWGVKSWLNQAKVTPIPAAEQQRIPSLDDQVGWERRAK